MFPPWLPPYPTILSPLYIFAFSQQVLLNCLATAVLFSKPQHITASVLDVDLQNSFASHCKCFAHQLARATNHLPLLYFCTLQHALGNCYAMLHGQVHQLPHSPSMNPPVHLCSAPLAPPPPHPLIFQQACFPTRSACVPLQDKWLVRTT